MDERLSAWLRFTITPGIGPVLAHRLLSSFGDPISAISASEFALSKILPSKVAADFRTAPRPEVLESVDRWLSEPGHHILTWEDHLYPQALLASADPPPLLFAIGRLSLLTQPALAIVGSRQASAGGIANAKNFARASSQNGLAIVSGLALGIDSAAHEGGLEGAGSTIAVVATGLDRVYPARNKLLAHRIAEHGLLLSEFMLGTPPLEGHFPRRNRIIAGLAQATLVVEATLASGSLITARLASEIGRDVFAIPGSIHSPHSKGCHQLIKQGAKLIDDMSDILSELKLPQLSVTHAAATTNETQAAATAIIEAMGFDPVTIDEIAQRSGAAVADIQSELLQQELAGSVVSLAGGRYQRLQ